jgi:hypothetical protein
VFAFVLESFKAGHAFDGERLSVAFGALGAHVPGGGGGRDVIRIRG